VYAVRLAGTLPEGALDHIPASLMTGTPQTVLHGEVCDDAAALRGLLRRLQSLNIAVRDVRRLPPVTASRPGTPAAAAGISGRIQVEALVGALGDVAQSFLGEVLQCEGSRRN